MSLFDDLFSKPDATPTMSTVDVAKELGVGASYNISQIGEFKEYAPDFASFLKSTFGDLQDPNAKAAEALQFDLGNQLAKTGQTELLGNFFDYSRRKGLETAAASGAPISGSFTQSLGSNLAAQQLLQNQFQGLGILNNQSQIQNQRTMSFLQPSFGILQQNMVNPQATLQAGFQNNEIINQNRMIDFANSQRQSWFDTLLSDTAKSVVGMPFSFVQNASNVAASSPQIAAGLVTSYFGGSGQGIPAANMAGQTSADGQMTQTSFGGGSQGGGGMGGLFGGLLG